MNNDPQEGSIKFKHLCVFTLLMLLGAVGNYWVHSDWPAAKKPARPKAPTVNERTAELNSISVQALDNLIQSVEKPEAPKKPAP